MASKNRFKDVEESSLTDDCFWFKVLSAFYVTTGFYAAMCVVGLMNVWNHLSYIGGVDYYLKSGSPSIFRWLDDGLTISGLTYKYLYILGLLSFLCILFLPRISKFVGKKFEKDHSAWVRGLSVSVICFILFVPIFLVPVLRIDLIPLLALVMAALGVLIGLCQAPLKPEYLAKTYLSSEHKIKLLELEIDKYARTSLLLFPFLIALGIAALISFGFSSPWEIQFGKLVDEPLRRFLYMRGQAISITGGYIGAGILAYPLVIGLRWHTIYNELRKLLAK